METMFIFSHVIMVICVLVIMREVFTFSNYGEEISEHHLIHQAPDAKPRRLLTMMYLSMIAMALSYFFALRVW